MLIFELICQSVIIFCNLDNSKHDRIYQKWIFFNFFFRAISKIFVYFPNLLNDGVRGYTEHSKTGYFNAKIVKNSPFFVFTPQISPLFYPSFNSDKVHGSTGRFLKFLKSLYSFIYKGFSVFKKCRLPFSCHFFKDFP